MPSVNFVPELSLDLKNIFHTVYIDCHFIISYNRCFSSQEGEISFSDTEYNFLWILLLGKPVYAAIQRMLMENLFNLFIIFSSEAVNS